MILFRNTDNLQSRVESLGTKIEGDQFPFFVKMPCRFSIIRENRRYRGKSGNYIIFHSENDLEIVTEKPEIKIETEEIEVQNVTENSVLRSANTNKHDNIKSSRKTTKSL